MLDERDVHDFFLVVFVGLEGEDLEERVLSVVVFGEVEICEEVLGERTRHI